MAPVKPNERKQKSRKKQKEAEEAKRAAKAAGSKRRRDEQKAEMSMLELGKEAPMNIRTATEATSVVTSQTLAACNLSSAARQQSQPSDRETPSFDHSNNFGQKTMSIASTTNQSSDVHEAHQPRGCEEAPSFASDDGSSNHDRSLKHPNLAVGDGAIDISTSRKTFSSSTTMTDAPTLSHEPPAITPMKSPPAAAAVGSGGHSAKKKRSRESSVDLDHLQAAVATSIDSPIPKKKKQRIDASPQASTASPKPNFFDLHNRNPNEINGKMMRDFEPTPAFEYNQPHVSQ